MGGLSGLFGGSSAKKARQIQRQQLELAKQQFEYNRGLTDNLNSQYDSQLNTLLNLINGGEVDGNTAYGQAQNYLQNVLDVLSGKTITDEQARANKITDDYINQLTGANKSAEQQTADEWNSKYLNMLAGSPDTAFNAGVTELARGIQTQNDNIRKGMQSRGISSSGINVAKLGSTAADQAKAMSQLQGQRIDRQLNNAGIASQFAQGLADKQQANMGTAAGLRNTQAEQKQNNLTNAANMSNAYSQQLMNNIMGVLGGKSGLIDHSAYSNYQNAMGNLANSYQQEANAIQGSWGNLLSTIATYKFGGIK